MNHASLFSGIGGFDLAAKWIGWDNIFQVEKDPWCQSILAKHFPNTERYLDIKEFRGEKYRGSVDVISGGFPCQPFSVAGKQKGKEDDRYLWPEMLRVIREIQPTWVVGENVPGIISMALDQVCTDLENEGYTVQAFIIPAASVNAIHKRDRVWILANNANAGLKDMRERAIGSISANTSSYGSSIRCKTKQRTYDSGEKGRLLESQGENSFLEYSECNGCTSSEVEGGSGKAVHESQARTDDSLNIKRTSGVSRTENDVSDSDVRRDRRYERESIQEGTTSRSGSAQNGGGYRRIKFPVSQPTICRGDDGVSYRLDNGRLITAKQRTNALKGLGNSVVPQVVYEIFRMIGKIK